VLYVAEAGADTVAVVDAQTGTISERLTLGRAPFALALNGNGNTSKSNILYATTPGDGSVWVVHLDGEPAARAAGRAGAGPGAGHHAG